MAALRLLVAALFIASAPASFAETPKVQDFHVVYHQDSGQTVAQESLRGVQRTAELQASSDVTRDDTG
jgi:hypothetical protein